MKDKINIAELIKECPKGMEFDCTICNNAVTLEAVDTEEYFPIRVVSKAGFHHALTREGCIYEEEDAKCVIFPKGKTTWEGFVPPNKFDINTLVPFESKVLIRDNSIEKWYPAIWGFYDSDHQFYQYKLVGVIARYCIPYEGNEHLLGTTDDCDEYFKIWE